MNNLIAEFELPCQVVLSRKTKKDKVIYLNINVYRNLHYIVNNQIKQLFEPKEIFCNLTCKDKIAIEYHIQRKDKRRYDIMNAIAIVDKFFCDWLIAQKYIEDDNHKIIQQYHIYTSDWENEENKIIAKIYKI